MFIGCQTYWILLTNQAQNDLHIIEQCAGWSDVFTSLRTLIGCIGALVHWCIAIHSSRDCCRYKHTDISFLRKLICSLFLFRFSRDAKTQKESCIGGYFLRTTPPVPFQIWLLLHEIKTTHPLIWNWKKKFEKCKIWGAYNPDNKNWPPFKVPKICLDLW